MFVFKKDYTKAVIIIVSLIKVNGHHNKTDGMFYIFQFTHPRLPKDESTKGQKPFINNGCAFQNCFVTANVSYFKSVKKFDAVLFQGVEIYEFPFEYTYPRTRYQKYVFVTHESSTSFPLHQNVRGNFDEFFNWTWTYRLDSDISYGYITVRDARGQIVGPKKDMHWIDIRDMKPTSKYVKRKLRDKKYAAAWFVSNCYPKSNRREFANKLKLELEKYGHRLDIFGRCGNMRCPYDGLTESCYAMLERDYYFYLAFENSFSEDYVTEKLLTALEHFTIPVVYGGANYTRFVPDGIYLNARALGPTKLAKEMVSLIQEKRKYYEIFRWHRYYTFHHNDEFPETNKFCNFCATLNNETLRTTLSVYENFSDWWTEKRTENLPEVATITERHITEQNSIIEKPKTSVFDTLYKYVVLSIDFIFN